MLHRKDGRGGQAQGTVKITVRPVNDVPVAFDEVVSSVKNTPITDQLRATDVDGDRLTYEIVNAGTMGTAEIIDAASGLFTYVPKQDATGEDTVFFRAGDGKLTSTPAAVTVTISPHVNIWLEAENGFLGLPMEAVAEQDASQGICIWVPNGNGDVVDPWQNGAGYAEFSFELPVSADYQIGAWVISNSLADNAFFVSLDYGPFDRWETALGAKEAWIWDKVTDTSGGLPVSYHLEAGQHTLVIKQAEDGAKIDKILITSNPDYNLESVYEDAEDGTIAGWEVDDPYSRGGQVTNLFDDDRQSNVIELAGAGMAVGYRLFNADMTSWSNDKQHVLGWSMKYSKPFVLYIDSQTSGGTRKIVYLPGSFACMAIGDTIYCGLGADLLDGKWHSFVRDLKMDVEKAEPGVTITNVDGFMILGSGRMDDIRLW